MGFFDQYPFFYRSSRIGSHPNRLNARYEALINGNRDVIEGRRILDIASHDGRRSFAALKAGAAHVIGIEGRAALVERLREAMATYGIEAGRYDFLVGDAPHLIGTFAPGSFDTVFCFGFLYHTLDHMGLLGGIARLRSSCLLLDTAVVRSDEPLIVVRLADTEHEGDAIRKPTDGPGPILVGTPSRPALELMLESAGFQFIYHDWPARHQGDWQFVEQYRDGARVTIRASLIR